MRMSTSSLNWRICSILKHKSSRTGYLHRYGTAITKSGYHGISGTGRYPCHQLRKPYQQLQPCLQPAWAAFRQNATTGRLHTTEQIPLFGILRCRNKGYSWQYPKRNTIFACWVTSSNTSDKTLAGCASRPRHANRVPVRVGQYLSRRPRNCV